MGETCEVVALGREDVCLEYKKLLTAYDLLTLDKTKKALADDVEFVKDASMRSLLSDAEKLLLSVEKNAFDDIEAGVKGFDVAQLDSLASSDADRAKLVKAVKGDTASVLAAAKKREASPTARAAIKLCNDLSAFANGL